MSETWIILVNYNGGEDTVECLESLRRHATLAKVIVVDNASVDGSIALIRQAHPWAKVIEAKENLGFTGGNNLAIREALTAGAEFVWLLNNDTVVEPGAIDELVHVMRADPSVGIVSPRIDYYDFPDIPWFAGSKLNLELGEAVHDNSFIPNDVVDTAWISGCAMFCRAKLLEQTEGFDDRYFLNWEDVDLSLRAIKLEWKLKLAPRAIVRHKVSRSLSQVSRIATYYWMRNRLLFTLTHATSSAFRAAKRDNYRRAIRSLWYREEGAWIRFRATCSAIIDANRRRFGKSTF